MALGDYTPTTWVAGGAPGISAAKLNNIENKLNEIDEAVGNDSGDIPLSNGTKCTNLDSDKVDGFHFRISAEGLLQYDSGSGWNDVGVICNDIRFADLIQASAVGGTWYTLLSVSDHGVLTRISAYAAVSNATQYLEVKVTVDGGTAQTWDVASATEVRAFDGTATRTDFITHVRFDTSLLIEVRQTTGGAYNLFASADYGLV